jgi:hypothetical protein
MYFATIAVASKGTPQPLVAASAVQKRFKRVTLAAGKATGANTGNVVIGDSSVRYNTKRGIELVPGDVYDLPVIDGIVNLADWYVDADNDNDAVRVMAW